MLTCVNGFFYCSHWTGLKNSCGKSMSAQCVCAVSIPMTVFHQGCQIDSDGKITERAREREKTEWREKCQTRRKQIFANWIMRIEYTIWHRLNNDPRKQCDTHEHEASGHPIIFILMHKNDLLPFFFRCEASNMLNDGSGSGFGLRCTANEIKLKS